jgi:alpha-amylase
MFSRSMIAAALASFALAHACAGQGTTNPDAAKPASPDGAKPVAPVAKRPAEFPLRANWWNDRVFYQAFVRSFKDSSSGPIANDGIGDFRGLIDKLDYLNDGRPETPTDLEVGGLWLLPIHPSPTYHGYDITDYFTVSSQYGSPDDFRELITQCHKRGIKVILDLVLNHTSNQIPWFQSALDPKDPKHDWYIWSESKPAWKGAWNQNVWHSTALAKLVPGMRPPPAAEQPGPFYFGMFSPTMPDLNFRNSEVTAQMLDVAKHWYTNYKVDGYRLDAIRHLIEDGQIQENTPATRDWLRAFQTYCKSVKPDSFVIGEVWSSTEVVSSYVPDQLDMGFEFDLAEAIFKTADSANRAHVQKTLDLVLTSYPTNQFATFLSNHDQTRVATRLKSDPGKLRVAAQLLLTLPGVPFIYYGEELGLTGDKPDENLRTPMPWSADPVAGFSLANAWRAPNADFQTKNVSALEKDPGSLLNLYRRYIQIRNDNPALAWGDYTPVMTESSDVIAFIRHAKGIDRKPRFGFDKMPSEQTALVVINLGGQSIDQYSLAVATSPLRGRTLTVDLGRNAVTTPPKLDEQGGFTAYKPVRRLSPFSAYVILFSPRPENPPPARSPVRPTN